MRLFIAIEFPEEIRRALDRSAMSMRESFRTGSLSRRENYHLTLVFLGETDSDGKQRAVEAMDACRETQFPLVIGAPGRFRGRDGDTIWRAVDGGEALLRLQSDLTRRLRERGFCPEERTYTPHLTLARRVRLRPDTQIDLLPAPPLRCTAKAMTLMLSERPGGVLTYTPLHRTPFYAYDNTDDQRRNKQ